MSDSSTIDKCQDALLSPSLPDSLRLDHPATVTKRYEELVLEANNAVEALQSAELNLVRAKENVADVTKRLEELRSLGNKLEGRLDHGETKVVACTNPVGSGRKLISSDEIPTDSITVHQAQAHMQEVPTGKFDVKKWYYGTGPGSPDGTDNPDDCDSYIDAAFRSSEGKAYLFMGDEYVLLDYTEGPAIAKVVEGPFPICKLFPFLRNTTFVNHGLDAAFWSGENEAIIFYGSECAKINYGSNPSYDLKLITEMFPDLQWTPFENGLDAAFDSSGSNEAYLFTDGQCARINYSSWSLVGTICPITEAFPVLRGTPFESGFEAAFTMKITESSYQVILFKGGKWAWIDFGCPAKPLDNPKIHVAELYPPLAHILPRKHGMSDRHDPNHCGCFPRSSIVRYKRQIYTVEEEERLMAAMVKAWHSGRNVPSSVIYSEMKEAEANKRSIGS